MKIFIKLFFYFLATNWVNGMKCHFKNSDFSRKAATIIFPSLNYSPVSYLQVNSQKSNWWMLGIVGTK